MPQRKIIHVDMDAFYASVEQRDRPELRGKPVAVGGSPHGRGVVAAASYEARVFGIHSAMPSAHAYRLCPDVVFVKPRFEVYRQVSDRIRAVFQRYTELIEPLSLDEAYLDVTGCQQLQNSATRIAWDIRQCILQETGLTASAGVSYNKFLAKLGSDINKPNGQCVITPAEGPGFIEGLPIGKFHGVGKATEAKMKTLGIHTGADLKSWTLPSLIETFGKVGQHYYDIARGIDQREVQNQRERKSVSSETTFEQDLQNVEEMLQHLQRLAGEVAEFLTKKKLTAQTVTIKVKYADFQLVTRSQTLPAGFDSLAAIAPWLAELLGRTEAGERKVRLLGVGASNLSEREAAGSQTKPTLRQTELFQ